jgi:hypothetical protein
MPISKIFYHNCLIVQSSARVSVSARLKFAKLDLWPIVLETKRKRNQNAIHASATASLDAESILMPALVFTTINKEFEKSDRDDDPSPPSIIHYQRAIINSVALSTK